MSITWKKTIRDVVIILIIGFLYYLFNKITGIGLSCSFFKITGLPCPCCGITRMFIHLSEFKFVEAFHDNQFLFFTWPFIALECVYVDYLIEDNKDIPRWNLFVIIGIAIALLCFGTLRILYHL